MKLGAYVSGGNISTPWYPGSQDIVTNTAPAAMGFLDWLQSRFPETFQALQLTRPDLLNAGLANSAFGFGDAAADNPNIAAQGDQTWYQNIADALKTIIPAYAQYSMQDRLISLNIERAKQGLPPVDSSTMAAQVNVGVSPQIQQLGTIAIFGLFGLAAIYLFTQNRRRS